MTKLWEPYDIPVVGLAGEVGSGKTLWGLTANPNYLSLDEPASTYTWDTEGSSASYVGTLNFDRMDIPNVLFHQGIRENPENTFLLWRDDLTKLPNNKYRVLMLDTITTIESGLVDYVKHNASTFGYTNQQFTKMEGVMWGVMKAEWKRLILIATQKCETLVLTTHMRNEYRGKVPTNRREPKGKETIAEVASIYMILSRKAIPGAQSISTRPSGICMQPGGKSRLVRMNPKTRALEPLLPPCIKDASPDGIRKYLAVPPNFADLKPEERAAPVTEMTEDDRLFVKAGIASDLAAKAQSELQLKESKMSTNLPVGVADHCFSSLLKTRLLTMMTVAEAKVLLTTRYNVDMFVQLNEKQLADLAQHLDSLAK